MIPATVTRLGVALRLEVLTQVRYKFLHAAVFSVLMWPAMLLPIPADIRVVVEPYVIFGDVALIGFFFIAAAVFFEKEERTLGAVVTSPLRFGEYLMAKLLVLTTVSVLLAVLIVLVTTGMPQHFPKLILGTALGTLLMLYGGFLSALPFDSVSDWFMLGVVPLAVLCAPLFHYAGVWEFAGLYAIPTHGPLLLIASGLGQQDLAGWQLGYAFGYPVAWLLVLYPWSGWVFTRYAVGAKGRP
ncbi:fluoroquinolone export ABC transporter permease subunit [Parasphingorhabdus pacifica]